jgi:transposase-like protein
MSVLSAPHFHNEEAAYAYVEARVWPQGPVCPHCGGYERIGKMGGASTRIGVHKCYQCRKPFTVKVGTIFESSHVPLRYWLQAMFLMASSKKGVSANQLHRTLGVTLKTAWFMAHRIREAMRSGDLAPFGSGGGDVEVDETYFTRDHRYTNHGNANMKPVVTLIDRNTGRARSIVVENATSKEVGKVVADNIAREARLITDASGIYKKVGTQFAAHQWVNHSKDEYVSKFDPTVHTNTVEGFYSIFKRGMKGIYQHCGPQHLHRYVAEFDFRYSNRVALGVGDVARSDILLTGIVGKRLTYRTTRSQA